MAGIATVTSTAVTAVTINRGLRTTNDVQRSPAPGRARTPARARRAARDPARGVNR
ncbi:hypothetical protein ABZ801_28900 [Actinomadura sp. NPDC047616]|uniref:hypothetical protein n=1 Tax=Actinomadura sp. NPDC047616 TaxID=3155914 RepID=UPI0033DBF9AA